MSSHCSVQQANPKVIILRNLYLQTYKCLSTPSEDILCNGNKTLSSASQYLEFPTGADDDLVSTLCDTSVVIENGLKSDSVIAKAVSNVVKKLELRKLIRLLLF